MGGIEDEATRWVVGQAAAWIGAVRRRRAGAVARSVLVRGGFYVIPEDGGDADREVWSRAVELLRTLIPGTLTSEDPLPTRNVIFRIALQDATGRESVAPD